MLACLLLSSNICWLLRTCCWEAQLEPIGLKIIKKARFFNNEVLSYMLLGGNTVLEVIMDHVLVVLG